MHIPGVGRINLCMLFQKIFNLNYFYITLITFRKYFCKCSVECGTGRAVEVKEVCHLSLTAVVKTPAEIDDHSCTSLTETAANHTPKLLNRLLKKKKERKADLILLIN